MARELVSTVLESHLRQLADNGLEESACYADIAAMRDHLDTLVETEMAAASDLLAELPTPPPCLVWVDPAVGRPVARWPLQGRERERPAVGPLCGEDGRLWMLEGELTAKRRSLVALLPEGEPQPMPTGIE